VMEFAEGGSLYSGNATCLHVLYDVLVIVFACANTITNNLQFDRPLPHLTETSFP